MAAGSMTVPPFAGWFAGRFGSHIATTAAGSALCLLLPGPLLAPNLPILMMALLLFGAANGMLDVSMNAQAVLIEDRYRRPILSSLHGLYSAGGLAGASLAAVATSASIPADFQVLGLAIFLVPLLFGATRFLVHEELGGAAGNRVLAWPRGRWLASVLSHFWR
jgi:MFS family permease